MLSFAPTTSMAERGEKSDGDLWINQSMCWGSRREPSFSGAVTLLNSVDDYAKCCHVRFVMSVYVSCISDFSYRIYIDSNHRNSQILLIACLVAAIR
jgi:hypothetical protein